MQSQSYTAKEVVIGRTVIALVSAALFTGLVSVGFLAPVAALFGLALAFLRGRPGIEAVVMAGALGLLWMLGWVASPLAAVLFAIFLTARAMERWWRRRVGGSAERTFG